jgi:hypothetical protein
MVDLSGGGAALGVWGLPGLSLGLPARRAGVSTAQPFVPWNARACSGSVLSGVSLVRDRRARRSFRGAGFRGQCCGSVGLALLRTARGSGAMVPGSLLRGQSWRWGFVCRRQPFAFRIIDNSATCFWRWSSFGAEAVGSDAVQQALCASDGPRLCRDADRSRLGVIRLSLVGSALARVVQPLLWRL